VVLLFYLYVGIRELIWSSCREENFVFYFGYCACLSSFSPPPSAHFSTRFLISYFRIKNNPVEPEKNTEVFFIRGVPIAAKFEGSALLIREIPFNTSIRNECKIFSIQSSIRLKKL
jgi:hypothetical protein